MSGILEGQGVKGYSFRWGILLLIFAAGLAAYSNTFNAPFHFDDYSNIIQNPLIQQVDYLLNPDHYCSNVGTAGFEYSNCHFFRMRYVGYLTFALNYFLHGLHVAGYHILNIAIHLMNACMICGIVLLTMKTPYLRGFISGGSALATGGCAALLFVAHPLQTQAVTYIVQRFTSLATLFYLLSLLSYIKFRLFFYGNAQNQGEKDTRALSPLLWYALSFISSVLAMKTKEIAFTLPGVLCLYEAIFFNGLRKQRVLRLLPFLLTLLIIPAGLVSSGNPLGQITGDSQDLARVYSDLSRTEYLFTQFKVVVHYLRLILYPVGQNLDYDFPVSRSFFIPDVMLSFGLLAFLLGASLYSLVKYAKLVPQVRVFSFGVLWFFVTLSVESSIIPITEVIAEHRVYLPSAGLFIAFATLAMTISSHLKKRWRNAQSFAAVLLCLAIVLLASATFARNAVWGDGVRLWTDVIRKSPNNARAYHNLGVNYYERGEIEQARKMYEQSVSLNPPHILSYYNLAFLYFNYKPGEAGRGYFYLGTFYSFLGNSEEARSNFRRACETGEKDGCEAQVRLAPRSR